MKPKPTDEISIGPEIAPGAHLALRRQGDEIREVVIRPAKDGEPLRPNSELAHVGAPRDDHWRDLTSIYKSGPAQVATPAYREGHDRIFGKKQKVGLA
jgi:hypothetical protein